jgi:hypothetical protein
VEKELEQYKSASIEFLFLAGEHFLVVNENLGTLEVPYYPYGYYPMNDEDPDH